MKNHEKLKTIRFTSCCYVCVCMMMVFEMIGGKGLCVCVYLSSYAFIHGNDNIGITILSSWEHETEVRMGEHEHGSSVSVFGILFFQNLINFG